MEYTLVFVFTVMFNVFNALIFLFYQGVNLKHAQKGT